MTAETLGRTPRARSWSRSSVITGSPYPTCADCATARERRREIRARSARGGRGREDGSPPVVEDQMAGVLVVLLLASLHSDHGEVDLVARLEEHAVRGPVLHVH